MTQLNSTVTTDTPDRHQLQQSRQVLKSQLIRRIQIIRDFGRLNI